MMDFMRSHQFDMLIFKIIVHLNLVNMIPCILRSVWFFCWNSRILSSKMLAIFNHIIALKFAKTHRSYHHHLSGIIRMCLITASRMPVMCCTPFFASPAFPLDAIGWGKWNSSTAKHPAVTSRLRVGSTAGKVGWDPEVNSRTCLGDVSLGLCLKIEARHTSFQIEWPVHSMVSSLLRSNREMIPCD